MSMASNSKATLLNSDEDLLLEIFYSSFSNKNFNKERLYIEGIRELECYCGKGDNNITRMACWLPSSHENRMTHKNVISIF